MEKIFCFDFEVFKHNWCVTFKNIKTNEKAFIKNDSLRLIDFIERHKKDSLFIGYNNKNFDNYCLKAIYYNINPYRVVEEVILNKTKPYAIPDFKYKKNIVDLKTMDCMEDLKIGLKEIEANIGAAIIEELHNIDNDAEEFTEEQWAVLAQYNEYDVDTTINIFNMREKEDGFYTAKKSLIERYNLDWKSYGATNTSLVCQILNAKQIHQDETFKYITPKCIKFTDEFVKKQFEEVELTRESKFSFKYMLGNLECKFGLGGIHSAIENYISDTDKDEMIVIADVDSMYLSLMANRQNEEFRIYPRTIDSWEKIADLRDDRVRNKYSSNKADNMLAIGQKKSLVSIYGATGQKSGLMEDWSCCRAVCITGQLVLFSLAERFHLSGFEVIQLNTDGIFIKCKKKDKEIVDYLFNKWQDETKLTLEVKYITNGLIAQKDVSNYIIYDRDKNEVIKYKGSYKRCEGGDYQNNHLSIIQEAVVKYLVYNIPINKTIFDAYENNEVLKFQYVAVRKGINFTHTKYGDKIVQKTNRCFASSDTSLPHLCKIKNGSPHDFTRIPDHCKIWNESIDTLNLKDIKLDKNYYINEALYLLKQLKGE